MLLYYWFANLLSKSNFVAIFTLPLFLEAYSYEKD